MSTSKSALQSVLTFTGGDVGHQVPVEIEEYTDQAGKNPPFNATPQRTVPEEVPPFPRPKKLTVRERLDRLSEHRIRPSSIRTNAKPRASGGKAEVVRTTFKPNKSARGERVAVKKLRFGDNTDQEKASKEFVNEVEILARLDHENIVRLVGFVEDFKRDKAWIVLSWEPNGSVRDFLKSGKWEIPERISLIKDVFKGLEYLHSRQPPIRHGDLKSDNILVSSSYRAVITDFGSARPIRDAEHRIAGQDADHVAEVVPTPTGRRTPGQAASEVRIIASDTQLTLTGPAWSLRWAAPEVVNEEDHSSLSSDMWSAGWVCWEIMTDKLPFSEHNSETAITLEIIRETAPLAPEHVQLRQVIKLWSLMMDCWSFEPKARPKADQCCTSLKWMPSILPFGGPSRAKESSTALLLSMGDVHYSQADFDTAASLFHKALANASVADCWTLSLTLLRLGSTYSVQSKYTEAERLYAQARDICALIGYDGGRAHAVCGLGDLYHHQAKFTEAEGFYNQAWDIFIRIGDIGGMAQALGKLGEVHQAQSKFPEAEGLYAQARDIYVRIGNDLGVAHALLGLGRVYMLQSKFPEAEGFCGQARDIYVRIGDDQGQANTLSALGDICLGQCRYPGAEDFYVQARDMYIRIGDEQGQARTLHGLGRVCCLQSKFTEAKAFHAQAREICVRIGNSLGRAHTVRGLGDVYLSQSRYPEAEGFYAQARDIYLLVRDDRGRARTLRELGYVCRVQSKFSEAEGFYAQARDIYLRRANDEGQAHALCGLGDVYGSQFRYLEAEGSYVQAREIYIGIGNNLGRANTLRGLGHLYRIQQHCIEAAALFVEARDLYAQIGRRSDEEVVSYWLGIVLEEQRLSTTSRLQPAGGLVPSD